MASDYQDTGQIALVYCNLDKPLVSKTVNQVKCYRCSESSPLFGSLANDAAIVVLLHNDNDIYGSQEGPFSVQVCPQFACQHPHHACILCVCNYIAGSFYLQALT